MVEKTFLCHELDWRYLSVEVTEEALEDAVRGIRSMGFVGANCARPHNRRIGAFLDRQSEVAERAGSVNLIRRDGSELVGESTEGQGVLQIVQTRCASPVRRVLLFGAGSLGRAVALELAEAGVEQIEIVNRTEERAASLVQSLGERDGLSVRWLCWEDAAGAAGDIDLVINATPVGTEIAEGTPPVDWQLLCPDALVIDANLEETCPELLHTASERGFGTVTGLDVFLEQAAINFRLWTGIEPDRTVMREAVEEYLEL